MEQISEEEIHEHSINLFHLFIRFHVTGIQKIDLLPDIPHRQLMLKAVLGNLAFIFQNLMNLSLVECIEGNRIVYHLRNNMDGRYNYLHIKEENARQLAINQTIIFMLSVNKNYMEIEKLIDTISRSPLHKVICQRNSDGGEEIELFLRQNCVKSKLIVIKRNEEGNEIIQLTESARLQINHELIPNFLEAHGNEIDGGI
ncbi:hypothetical protein SNEBB_006974 [Seison nebaliae]|nr:hypothetical protein SNEBB_006974 [Seison nebaliae]